MNAQAEKYRRILREQLPTLSTRFHVKELGMFGSQVRGDSHPGSDLDLLVSFSQPPSLIRLIELENELTDLLGVKVDMVLQDSLKPRIGRRIRRELAPI